MKKAILIPLLALMLALPWAMRAQGGCTVSQFPWSESFDSWSGLGSCWSWTMGGSDGSFQLYSSYNHTGPGNSVKCPSPDPYMIALPPVDAPLNELTVTFWLYKDDPWGFLPGQVQVGYCTDTSNLQSFTMVENVTCTPASSWTLFTVSFAGVPESATGRIAFCKPTRVNSGLYLDDVALTRNSSCGDATGLRVAAVGQHVAGLRWENSLGEEGSYVVRYRTVLGQQWDSMEVQQPYCFLSGLLSDTDYVVAVRSDCPGEASSFCPAVIFRTAGCGSTVAGQVDSTSGNGHTVDYPINGYQNYSYAQMVYPASQLGNVGTDSIRGLALFNLSTYTLAGRTLEVRMALSDRTGFDSYYDQESWELMESVFTGTVAMHYGWCHIALDRPFAYDGMSNLVVALYDQTNQMSFFATPWWAISDMGTGTAYYSAGSSTSATDMAWGAGQVTGFTPVMRFLSTCDPTASCLPPLAMVVGGDPNSIDLLLQPGGSEQAWDVAFRPVGQDWWYDYGTTTDRENTLSGLDPGTVYQIRLSTLCAGDETRSTFLTGQTECGAIALPYRQGFDAQSEYSTAVPCWTLSMGAGSTQPMVETPMGQRSKMLALGAGGYAALPEVDEQYDMAQLNLRLLLSCPQPNEWSSATYGIEVGVMEDPDSLQGFIPLGRVTSSSTGYHTFSFDALDTLETDARHVAVRALSSNGWEAVHVDDLWLRLTPSCPTPTGLQIEGTTASSATLSWQGQSSSYLLEYGPAGMAMGSGTFVAASSSPATLSGLQAGTIYDVYLYGVCSDTSFAAGPLTVTTDCGAVTLPYTHMFDSEILPNTAHTATMPLCWTVLGGTAEVYRDLNLYEGTSFSGQNSLRMASGSTVALPLLGGHTASQVQVDLEAMAIGTGAKLILGVCDSLNAGSFVAVDSINVSDYTFAHATRYMVHYQGTGLYLALRALGAETYVDNVVLSLAPSCLPVTDLHSTGSTATTVTLAWTEQGNASQWEVAYDTVDSTPASGTVVSSNPYTLTGLTPGEMVYVYVRSYCSATDQGEWVGPLAVAANSWTMRANRCDTLRMCNGMIFDDGGASGDYANNQTSMVILRPEASEGPSALHLVGSGHALTYSYSECDYIRIYEGIDTNRNCRYSSGTSANISFDLTIHSGVATIVFVADEWQSAEGFQIHVECLPVTCPMVDNLTATTTESSLTASWTPQGSESQWVVTCGDRDTVVSTPSVTFVDLYPSSNYEVSVRPLCGVGDTGVAVSGLFSTACDVVMLTSRHPFFESFESPACPANECWTLLHEQNAYNNPIHTTAQALHGERSFRFSSYDGSVSSFDQYLVTPQFFSAEPIQASFAYRGEEDFLDETLVVGYSPSSSDPSDSSWVWIDTILCRENALWTVYSATLPASAAFFGLHYANTRDCYYLYIDSLTLTTSFSGCATPTLATPEVLGYDSARLAWSGNLQLVEGTEMTLSGLLAGTAYQYRVRMVCPEGEFSNWAVGSFTTEVLPCYTPSNLRAENIAGTSASLVWTPGDDEEEWQVRYWAQGDTFTVSAHGEAYAQLEGLFGGVSYGAVVRSVCGGGAAFSDWSDTVRFTTLTCDTARNVVAAATSYHTATVTWQGEAPEWTVKYGQGVSMDELNNILTVNTTSCELTGLEADAVYYVTIVANCGENWSSAHTIPVPFHTPVGIAEAGNGSALRIFPNPASDKVVIDFAEGNREKGTGNIVEIIDLQGRCVLRKDISPFPLPYTLHLQGLASGTYFVKMGAEVRKLVVR